MEFKIGFLLVFTLLVLIINSNVDATEPMTPAAGGAAPTAPAAGGAAPTAPAAGGAAPAAPAAGGAAPAAPAAGGAAPATGGATPAAGGAAPGGGGTVFDITKLGTTPNGDATQGIMAAWKEACAATSPSEILIPAGEYTLGPVKLEGPCKCKITITVNGNFKSLPADKFGPDDNALLKLRHVSGVIMQAGAGGGVFDGQGLPEYSKNKCDQNKDCKMMPMNFRFDFVNDSTITGLTSKDSKAFHINFMACNRVNVQKLTISAPAGSPNTDGIHIGRSDGINITDTKIGTGDDCVSMGDGARNINVERVTCGPGHGISIGSVGGTADEAPLMGITVKCCNLTGTDNGVRIKTWLDSFENLVSGVLFEDITVDNVKNPIVIDQEYCPYNHCKSKAPSKVKLSDIKIKNVRGTSSSVEVVTLACSSLAPCEKIEVSDVDLKYVGKEPGTAQFICKNFKPVTTGVMVPPPCTSEGTPNAPPSAEL